MPVTATIPVTGDYREIILPAGYADNVRCLLVGGDHLFLCTDTNPGSLLKVRKDDFSVHSVVTFSNDTEHKNAIDAVYVPGSSLANDRVYVLFAWGPATPGLLMISQVNPNADSNNAPTIVNEDYVREEDFTPGVAGCIDSDGTNLYVLSGYADAIRIATIRLSDAGVAFSPALSPDRNGWVLRASGGRLYAVGKTLDEFGDTWVKRINPGPPINPPQPSNPSVETAITITNGTDFYLMPEDIGVSTDHLWIGMRGNPAGFGKIKKVTKSGLTVTDFTTGILSAARTVKLAGSFIWALFDNGKAARINPSSGDLRLYTLNDGQGFQSLINTDADGFLYTAWHQTGTKIARYRIPSDVVESGEPIWAVAIGGTGTDFGNVLTTDAANNIYIAGSFNGTINLGNGTANLISSGDYDIFVAKYSPDGLCLWSAKVGGTGREVVTAIALDPSGNVIISGNLNGFGLVKLVPSGNTATVAWNKAPPSVIQGMDTDSIGNIYVTGTLLASYLAPLDFGEGHTIYSNDRRNAFVAKYDSSGICLLATAFVDTVGVISEGTALKVDRRTNPNTVYIAGFSDYDINLGGGNIINGSSGRFGFLGKFDVDCNHLYSRSVGTKTAGATQLAGSQIKSLTIDANGDVAVCGVWNYEANFGNGLRTGIANFNNGFVAKYSGTDLHSLWDVLIKGDNECVPSAIAADSQNNVVAVGYFQTTFVFGTTSKTANGTGSSRSNDCFVVKYASDERFVWVQQFGLEGSDNGYSVAIDQTGSSIITGYAQGNVPFGSHTITSHGGFDAFLAKLNP